MNDGRRSVPRWASYLWLLLVLPAPWAIGWGIGQLPTPVPPPADAERAASATAPTPARAANRRAITVTETRDEAESEPAPPGTTLAAREAPAPQRAPAVLSAWTTFDDALAESQRNGKPVLIDFNADWCPPCQKMKQQVFEDRSHGETVQNAVIPVSIVDRRRETGSNPPAVEDLQRRYQIDAFPTLIVYSPASGRTVRTQGFGDPEATVRWITEAARSVR